MVTIILLYTFYYIIDIRVIIIGVGAVDWETKYVECLTQSTDDIIEVADFTEDDFDSILGSLSEIICPISLDFKITEVKPEKNDDCYRCDRFVEIWNSGIGREGKGRKNFNNATHCHVQLISLALNETK